MESDQNTAHLHGRSTGGGLRWPVKRLAFPTPQDVPHIPLGWWKPLPLNIMQLLKRNFVRDEEAFPFIYKSTTPIVPFTALQHQSVLSGHFFLPRRPSGWLSVACKSFWRPLDEGRAKRGWLMASCRYSCNSTCNRHTPCNVTHDVDSLNHDDRRVSRSRGCGCGYPTYLHESKSQRAGRPRREALQSQYCSGGDTGPGLNGDQIWALRLLWAQGNLQ